MNREKLIEDMRDILCADGGDEYGEVSRESLRAALAIAERAIAEEWLKKAAHIVESFGVRNYDASEVASRILSIPLPGDA